MERVGDQLLAPLQDQGIDIGGQRQQENAEDITTSKNSAISELQQTTQE